ncbi:MAG: hypothetical protein C5B53_13080 [Candidatus Melainabacteria bacterium]|nr:MAG: hypothetical protein C5B53_13080 [Candidatus Melainabacteria bacterium]
MAGKGRRQIWQTISLLVGFSLTCQAIVLAKNVSQEEEQADDYGHAELVRLQESMARFDLRRAKLLERVPRLDPAHEKSERVYQEGRRLMGANKLDPAISKFSQFLEQFRNESQSIKNEKQNQHDLYLAWGYQCRGFCYLKEGQYEKGIQDLSEAIKLRPRYAVNYANRAKAYRLIGQPKLAKEDEAKVRSLPRVTGDMVTDWSQEFPSHAEDSK